MQCENLFCSTQAFASGDHAYIVIAKFLDQFAPKATKALAGLSQDGGIGKLLHRNHTFASAADGEFPAKPVFLLAIRPDKLSGSHQRGCRIAAAFAFNDFIWNRQDSEPLTENVGACLPSFPMAASSLHG